jgi:hypothetical protein
MVKQNPFSLYDFLGYFIPGALFLYLITIIDLSENKEVNFIYFVKNNNAFEIDKLLFLSIISYAIGHLINFISSITIEKYAIWRYGYPSKFLLGFESDEYWKSNNTTGNLLRVVLPIIIFPITILDYLIGNCLNLKDLYTRKLDPFLIAVIKEKGMILVKKLFKNKDKEIKNFKLRDFDFFRIFAHYTFENSKNHQTKLVNYVVLYGFLRTLTLITVTLLWYLIYSIVFQNNKNISINILISTALVSYLFFMAFMKFYRRYTLEGLMLIAIDRELE